MNFLEAVQALHEGECEGIKRSYWDNSITTYLTHKLQGANWVEMRLADILADDWILVGGAKEKMETVEVARWFCIHGHSQCDGTDLPQSYANPPIICGYSNKDYRCNCKEFVKFTAQIPAKKKVKRRELLGRHCFAADMIKSRNIEDPNVRAYLEWEE